jgi:hypothetical protein
MISIRRIAKPRASGHHERNPAEVERLASELIELSTRENFSLWLAGGAILRG